MRVLCLGTAVLLALSGCATAEKSGNDAAGAATTTNADRALTAAAVANAMAANAAAADSILAAAGYTRDSFQQFMYEIAADSTMSAAYASAKKP